METFQGGKAKSPFLLKSRQKEKPSLKEECSRKGVNNLLSTRRKMILRLPGLPVRREVPGRIITGALGSTSAGDP